jgi:hypothetical protein
LLLKSLLSAAVGENSMRNSVRIVGAALVAGVVAQAAQAATITIQRNGYNGPNGQVTGSGLGAPVGFGSGSADIVFNVQPNGTYSVDFFHTSGVGSSDFSFGTDASSLVANRGTNVGGTFAMGTAGSVGTDTFTLNSHTVTLNGLTPTAGYAITGIAAGVSGSVSGVVLPGSQHVDAFTPSTSVDWDFVVNDTGGVLASSGSSNGIPHAEYATFSGSTVDARNRPVKFVIDSNLPMAGPNLENAQQGSTASADGGRHKELVELNPIGNSGVNNHDFNGWTVVDSNVIGANGLPIEGTSGSNDFLFQPQLRYNGVSPYGGFYFNLTDGPGGDAYAVVTGFTDSGSVLTMTMHAEIPEPSGVVLLAAATLGIAARRRRGV